MTTSLLFQTGVHRDVPMQQYHAIAAASNHRLSVLRQSPAHLKAYLEQAPEDSRALLVGKAAHTAILEPDDFDLNFAVAQQCEAIKKSDRLQCSNMGTIFSGGQWLCGVHGRGMEDDESRLILPANDFAACRGMRDAVYAHRSASQLLTGPGDIELTVIWHDDASGVLCKGRYDRHTPLFAGGAIIDLKTCVDASRAAFERSIYAHGYHRQGAFYLDAARALGIPADHFVIVAVEKTPPYAVAVYRLTEGALEAGREQLRILLQKYAWCVDNDEWPGYSSDVVDVALPNFAWGQIDEELREAVSV